MRLRLDPQDDLLHAADADVNFNESRYYNFFDAPTGLGGWVRMGNRPNQGYAEMTVCLYLPDGRVGFMFKRPSIDSHEAHDAGGLRFEVLEPFTEHRVSYDGKVCLPDQPREMTDPKSAFSSNPHEPALLDLRVVAVGGMFGGEPEYEEGEQPPTGTAHGFARGHTEQHMAITGVAEIGAQRFELTAGLGLRDQSWGPRVWQSIPWYRWLNASFGSLGIACTLRGVEGSPKPSVNGFVYDIERYGHNKPIPVREIDLHTDYEAGFAAANSVVVRTDDHAYELHGVITATIPLRNRREGRVTRITEGMTRWTCESHEGGGLSEYLDQIVDEVPVGFTAGV
jgi:hypothetical protein